TWLQVLAGTQPPRKMFFIDDERLSAEEMDERRRQNIAYEYLCHLEEAKRWMEACLRRNLPPTTEREEGLRNGVYLGKLANFFAPKMVSVKRIYDRDQARYKSTGLHFRHTDNTVQWLRGHGKEEISNMRSELDKYGIQMPLSVTKPPVMHAAVIAINEAVDKGQAPLTMGALNNPNAMLRNLQGALDQDYQDTLSQAKARSRTKDVYEELLTQQEIQNCIDFVNTKINTAIRLGNAGDTVEELSNPEAQLPIVYQTAANLYQNELFSLQLQGRSGLSHGELSTAVEMLSALAVLNEVLDTKDPQACHRTADRLPAGFTNIDQDNLNSEEKALTKGQEFLTWNEVQECIDTVNIQVHEEHERIIAIAEINEALNSGDHRQTLAALLLPTAQADGPSLSGDESAVLWLDQIQEAIRTANQDDEEALACKLLKHDIQVFFGCYLFLLCFVFKNRNHIFIDYPFLFLITSVLFSSVPVAGAVADINRKVAEGDSQNTLQALQVPSAGIKAVLPECAETYQVQLVQRQTDNTDEGSYTEENALTLIPEYDYYYNLETGQGSWEEPEGFQHNSGQLSKDEIQSVVSCVTADYNRGQMWLANESLVTQLQARIRGYLVRKKLAQRMEYLRQQEPHVVRLQACWKGYKQRKMYKERMDLLQQNVKSIVKVMSLLLPAQYLLPYVCVQEKEIVKIQAFLKANKARDDYRTLTGAKDPPLSVVRKFVHLLEQSPLDLQEEQEVTRLREEVVTKIRSNQQMEKDLNLMDIKIGLLVKNRITLQDVVLHNKKMTKMNKASKDDRSAADKLGIKGLSKGKRRKLEAYQHLFYLLQTNPSYLAKLIFQMPQNKSTKFMDTVIFTLYNYASNQREEYLLLKLFKTALEEEINSKVDQIQDIVTGNPTVIKMVVSFNRGARGHNTLRQLLAPVVKEIIEDKNLGINTNPVDVYKAWVNQLETATGEASKLPYEVTPEQAMSHEEVRSRLQGSSLALRTATDKVLNSIVSSLDNIPYGMRYISKVLKNSLHEKFPDASEDELMKIVGNLLYYRYMNPAIVAPDGFDIIDMSAGGQLHQDQRRNLGSVAKMLQHAAANKLFEGENAHMTPLNNYISQTYEKFRLFFQSACDVPEPEEKFNVDEYSDMVTLSKPIIYISIEEIINTHSLLLEHLEAISPDKNDLLHELLQDLGDVPDVEALLGEGAADPSDPNRESALSQLGKTEISLTLTSKFELLDGDDKDLKTLITKTKKLIVDVIRIQHGETLTEILETPATNQQELEHTKIAERRAVQDAQTPEGLKSSAAVLEDSQLPLEQKKRKILRNLRSLEQAGLVAASSRYQELINEISKDIRYQRRYRQRRKAELVKLQQTLTALNSKTDFFQDQMNYYDTYIKTCLDNLNRKNSRRSIKLDSKGGEKGSKKGKPQSLKYTAARLHEKGVILEIEGLQTNQFKNVMFDISPSEEVGDFEVKAKFMGVEMEKVQLHFQDLLQLQYEGVAVMKMFDKAKVNVNLLIFLLNKKFYGK
uniref:IQ motif containing GTPase activating protein 2 n=1 Tax=Salarias fasciatus TaxID=181472 RepID=A0A672H305_SALFA